MGVACLFTRASEDQPGLVPLIVARDIAAMSFGEFVSLQAAELFGVTLLGPEMDTYYLAMCEIADSLPSAAPSAGDREA